MNFEQTEEWRSTPPTHVAQALHTALLRLRDGDRGRALCTL